MAVHRLRRVVLLEAARGKDGDAVAHADGLRLVVRDEDRRQAQPRHQLAELHAHFRPELRVQRGQRLVEENALRLRHHRPGEGHALLLPAGELVRVAVRQFLQMHDGERLPHPLREMLRPA